jgi:hypothetical protein
VSQTPDLLALLKSAPTPAAERRLVRSIVALHAGRMLLVEPQQFEPMTALNAALSVPYVRPERADEVLRAAGVYPLRRGRDLRQEQRRAFAEQLLVSFGRSGS